MREKGKSKGVTVLLSPNIHWDISSTCSRGSSEAGVSGAVSIGAHSVVFIVIDVHSGGINLEHGRWSSNDWILNSPRWSTSGSQHSRPMGPSLLRNSCGSFRQTWRGARRPGRTWLNTPHPDTWRCTGLRIPDLSCLRWTELWGPSWLLYLPGPRARKVFKKTLTPPSEVF